METFCYNRTSPLHPLKFTMKFGRKNIGLSKWDGMTTAIPL